MEKKKLSEEAIPIVKHVNVSFHILNLSQVVGMEKKKHSEEAIPIVKHINLSFHTVFLFSYKSKHFLLKLLQLIFFYRLFILH